MTTLSKAILIIFTAAICTFALRGDICYRIIQRKDILTIDVPFLENKTMMEDIAKGTKGMSPEEMVAFCDRYAKRHLSFSLSYPHNDISYYGDDHREHCVGYADYFSAALSYAFRENGVNGRCIHIRGHLYIGEIVPLLSGRIGRYGSDHDYVRIEGNVSGIVDPSLDDILLINPSYHLRNLKR